MLIEPVAALYLAVLLACCLRKVFWVRGDTVVGAGSNVMVIACIGR